jgi:hypothetical protein
VLSVQRGNIIERSSDETLHGQPHQGRGRAEPGNPKKLEWCHGVFVNLTKAERAGLLLMDKLFSIDEANSVIPRLKLLLARVRTERERMLEMRPELEKAQENYSKDWGTHRGAEYIEILDAFQQAMSDIDDLGVLVKDIDIGLCDFPHKRDGRVVYLCWKLDEEEISWWHDLEAGFAGRQPL